MFAWLRNLFATQPLRVDQVAADAEQFRREQNRIERMRKWRSLPKQAPQSTPAEADYSSVDDRD